MRCYQDVDLDGFHLPRFLSTLTSHASIFLLTSGLDFSIFPPLRY
uniref:Uncharacterized protein n=1 Tax=Arundo donax TaxID=35708 RepID=A0A0A9AJE9_ARUDO